jgi:hypothetical protein
LYFQRRIPETTKRAINTKPRTIPAFALELRCLCVAELCESVGEAPDAVVEVELEEGSGSETPGLIVEIAFEEEGRSGDAVASRVVVWPFRLEVVVTVPARRVYQSMAHGRLRNSFVIKIKAESYLKDQYL